MFSVRQHELFFSGASDGRLWIGLSQSLARRIEAVPFKYDALKYVMLFAHPADYLGGEDEVGQYAHIWASGFVPN